MNRYRVQVNQKEYQVDLIDRNDRTISFLVEGERYDVSIAPGRDFSASQAVQTPVSGTSPSTSAAPIPSAAPGEVLAPMPGIVVSVKVAVGDSVSPGDTLLVIEAMKMENNITAGQAGTVSEILVSEGQEVGNNSLLVKLSA